MVSYVDLTVLQQAPLFEGLDAEALAEVHGRAARRFIGKGTVLFRQGEPAGTLFVIAEGRIRVSEVMAEGEEVLLRFIQPVQMLGGMAALEGTTYPVTAEAAEPTTAFAWETRAMQRLMDPYPAIARNAMRLMVGRIRELQQRCVDLATQRVEQRVARALTRLAEQTGERVEEGVALGPRLSRQDVAQLTGTTLYTVSRLLSRWSEQGIVAAGRQRLLIRKPHALVALADNLPPREKTG